jgi:hypothetical protein
MFEQLSPGQRQALMYGAPAAAALGVIALVRKKKTPAGGSTTTADAAPTSASTDAIGVGQLTEFESMLTDQLATLAQQVNTIGSTPVAVPSLPVPTAPAPPVAVDTNQASANLGYVAGFRPPPPTPADYQPAAAPARAAPVNTASGQPAEWANVPPGWYDDINRPLWWPAQ